MPEDFEQIAAYVRSEDVRENVLLSADLDEHAAWLAELAGLGFEELYLHHVGQQQAAFIEAFGRHVLPALTAGTVR